MGIKSRSGSFTEQCMVHAPPYETCAQNWIVCLQTGRRGFPGEGKFDETFVGCEVKNMRKDRRQKFGGGVTGKTAVMGMLDRDQRKLRATVVPNIKCDTLQTQILNNVKCGTPLYSDDCREDSQRHPFLYPGFRKGSKVVRDG